MERLKELAGEQRAAINARERAKGGYLRLIHVRITLPAPLSPPDYSAARDNDTIAETCAEQRGMIHLCGNFATCRPAPRRDRIRYIAGKKDSSPRARTAEDRRGRGRVYRRRFVSL
jgi:hypothetical protein